MREIKFRAWDFIKGEMFQVVQIRIGNRGITAQDTSLFFRQNIALMQYTGLQDKNGNYCKENCRWATSKEQANNRSDNVKFNGETAQTASERITGKKGSMLVLNRLDDGWTREQAFTSPLQTLIKRSSKGYYFNKKIKKYAAKVMRDGIVKNVGYFSKEIEAQEAVRKYRATLPSRLTKPE